MLVEDIRRAFLAYFQSHHHTVVPSSSLVPVGDDTLLFTNAGMVQFKDAFLGNDRGYKRATSSQRCVRAGGKHNDLENVGYTARHHTFFEMLGNFSFGDYFKREAIQFAWTFLTEELGLPAEKLWVTVYEDDQEAEDIWLNEMKVSAERFSRCGKADNFWAMGDTGPCGPCTEIFYDHGPEVEGGPPGSPEAEGDRYIEIWNLVFMQYNRLEDGQLTPLPKPSVDTGMGLERIAAVMQNVHSNYEINLFVALLNAAAEILGIKNKGQKSLQVIADHIRSVSFLVVDGVVPGNEGRGYVLRRIIRRAVRHGHRLGASESFFFKLVPALVQEMGQAYPELAAAQSTIESVIAREEKQFAKTLDQGMSVLTDAIQKLSDKVIPGELAFKLYDTYGFPFDLTADFAREHDMTVDEQGFSEHMAAQKARARAHQQFNQHAATLTLTDNTTFVGYELDHTQAVCIGLYQSGEAVESLSGEDAQALVVLNQTPFYAESGGQVGDTGHLETEQGHFVVTDTQKMGNAIVHIGYLKSGSFAVNASVKAYYDASMRQQTARNHSATHLLHAALRQHLGEHVQQKGSLVTADRLRFDFTHPEPISQTLLDAITATVNQVIIENTPVNTELMTMDEAKQAGAVALFGEKYGDSVRVLSMGRGFSKELCGGTHVTRTGDIALFQINSESGVAAGVRRIEAMSGLAALAEVAKQQAATREMAALLKTEPTKLQDKLASLLASHKQQSKEIGTLQQKLASGAGTELISHVKKIKGVSVLAVKVPSSSPKVLRDTMDQLKQKMHSGVIVLAAIEGDKVSLVAGVTKDMQGQYHAGKLVSHLAGIVGGRGGGRPDMAQAGGSLPEKLPDALNAVELWVSEQVT